MTPYTLSDAARKTGWHKSQVSRWAKRLKFGRRRGRSLELTWPEVRTLYWLRQATQAGNPDLRR